MRKQDTSVGFVGVGMIASSMVEALLTGPNADHIDVVLSPRSASRSADLVARHTRTLVATDSQTVVDAAEIVILAVLPTQVDTVCSTLKFRSDQIVVGLPAGWPPSRLGRQRRGEERVRETATGDDREADFVELVVFDAVGTSAAKVFATV